MKIFALTIVILALNGYVTRATSLDPLENVEIDDTRNDRDDSRTKRSGNIFSSLLKKKFGLLSSLSGTSSGKSIGHSEHFPDHFEEPLSYHTKSFNLWGVKKAIMSSVFQAAKAITGGVIALKGQLIKAKGHAVVAKGKLLQTKGEAISNFGKTIATHAFDVHHEPQLDVQSSGGLYNHLPVTPIHQPTSYGAATAFGYQGQAYPSNVFQGNAYQNSVGYQVAPSYQTGFGVPQTGYGGGNSFGGYGGNSFTAKRAAVQNSQESNVNQVQSAFDKDSVQAGLLIFKPIKMPAQNIPTSGNSASATQTTTSSQQQVIGQRPSQQQSQGAFNPTDFKTTQQSFGFQRPFTSGFQTDVQSGRYSQYSGPNSYQVPDLGYQSPNLGYRAPDLGYRAPDVGYPSNGVSSEQKTGPQTFDFQQPANSQDFGQDFGQQLATFAGQQQQQLASFPVQQQQVSTFPVQQQQVATFPVQQQQPASFSQESYEDDLSSGADERVAQPSYKRVHLATKRGSAPASERLVAVAPSTTQVAADAGYGGDGVKTQKRSAPLLPSRDDVIVPLKYHDDSTAEDQARLKQTVQRFFSILQKQR